MKFTYNPDQLANVAEKLELRLVILFGSRARGSPAPTPDSDIDIAILGLPKSRYWDCLRALGEVFRELPLDVVRLENADPLFRHEVMHKAILLWGDPDLFSEYRAFAYRDFIDSADLFGLEQVLFTKKMKLLRDQLYDSPCIRAAQDAIDRGRSGPVDPFQG